jgi:catechol 2,3-dioxygenase-like lactoylglutathione lyase family enzyme
MSTKIFVNLPVKDLARSTEFFTKLGFSVDESYTDKNAGCLVISDNIYVHHQGPRRRQHDHRGDRCSGGRQQAIGGSAGRSGTGVGRVACGRADGA